jgi:TRAP transporter TAXI family solute receptor
MLKRGVLLVAVWVSISIGACRGTSHPVHPTTLTFATGRHGSIYDELGGRLIDLYATELPDITVLTFPNGAGSLSNVQNLRLGEADIGFAQADTAYLGYKRSSELFRSQIRGISVLYVNAVQLIVREDSPVKNVTQFRGRRIGVGVPGSASDVATRAILESYGLKMGDVRLLSHDDLPMSEIAMRIRDGRADVAVVATSYPVPTITDTVKEVGIRLVPIERDKIAGIRSKHLFYEPAVIPAGTYPGQRTAIDTIGIHTLLVCREDLPEGLVYRITKAFYDALPRLRLHQAAAHFIDPELAPATSIPLHSGAARFYRERELTQ